MRTSWALQPMRSPTYLPKGDTPDRSLPNLAIYLNKRPRLVRRRRYFLRAGPQSRTSSAKCVFTHGGSTGPRVCELSGPMFPPQQRSIITNVDLMETQYFTPIKILTDLIDVNVREILGLLCYKNGVLPPVFFTNFELQVFSYTYFPLHILYVLWIDQHLICLASASSFALPLCLLPSKEGLLLRPMSGGRTILHPPAMVHTLVVRFLHP
jgi:hypothetical protein